MKKLPCKKVKIFSIKNRKGYAGVCMNHLTEGNTPYQTYLRMAKALKRSGFALPEIDAAKTKTLITTIG